METSSGSTLSTSFLVQHLQPFWLDRWGGSLSRGEGNSTPHAAFNVSCDPDATNIVINMAPPSSLSQQNLAVHSRAFWEHEGFMSCNAYAVAILLHPENIKTTTRIKGHIHLALDEKRGASLYDKHCPLEEANVTLVTEKSTHVFSLTCYTTCQP
ncbi:hypothetical protein PsorP6_009527 [Peronosclerospora sorghi]|uniref:Uncharacterized protein n=1 Tax=Peronosclerospora sorghi TaxID=230839 RepID=A0ACC0VYB5_9STRA|nr:hypothetical protein PsorP6_009527 [Peronosclerospora sorghi]